MEIATWAESLLLGEKLADKLRPPGATSDQNRGRAWGIPDAPGRGATLRPSHERAPFPSEAQVEEDHHRAALLHAFANHELLAIELMALMLLRFPDAPPGLRAGLAATIADEQRHLGLYLERMATLGMAFGAAPLNRFLWDCLANAASPAHFLAGMSLVFEQANVDHARAWRDVFTKLGDRSTAALLETIRVDEIGHVAGGLHWFNRLTDAKAPLWDRWQAHLSLPLTPARARGPTLDRDARRDAGLPDDFIGRLDRYRHSRGRHPDLWWFDPHVEAQIAHGRPGYSPPAAAAAIGHDLQVLPALLAREDDAVLVDRPPAPDFLDALLAAGLPLPRFVCANELTELPVRAHRPWGWSPDSARIAGDASAWRPEWRALSSKAWSARWRPNAVVCTDAEAVERAVAAKLPDGAVLLKAPLSTSGRGRQRVGALPLPTAIAGWVRSTLASQGAVVVEPWRERVLDLSAQITVLPDGRPRVDGLCRFFTDGRGGFLGAVVGRFDDGLDGDLRRFLYDGPSDGPRGELERAALRVGEALAAEGYRGPAGMDAMVYRHRGELVLEPILEVNPRFTMGRIALQLARIIAPRAHARWWITPLPPAPALPKSPTLDNGRLRRGSLYTSDPRSGTRFTSILVVSDDIIDTPPW